MCCVWRNFQKSRKSRKTRMNPLALKGLQLLHPKISRNTP